MSCGANRSCHRHWSPSSSHRTSTFEAPQALIALHPHFTNSFLFKLFVRPINQHPYTQRHYLQKHFILPISSSHHPIPTESDFPANTMFNDINHIWWVGGPHLQNLNSTPIDELLCDKAALKIWAGKIDPTWHQPAQANRLHTAHFHILGHLSWNYKCHPMTLFNPKDNLPYLTNITEPEKLSNCWLFKFNTWLEHHLGAMETPLQCQSLKF